MKLLVLDGNSIVNRAFYGIKLLSTKDGQFTNAIYGFLTMLEHIRKSANPTGLPLRLTEGTHLPPCGLCGYKAGRKGMPEELANRCRYKRTIGLLGTPWWNAPDGKLTTFWVR